MRLAPVSETGPLIHLAVSVDWDVPTGRVDVQYELGKTASIKIVTTIDARGSAALAVAEERDAVLLTNDLAPEDQRPPTAARYIGPSA